jgi:hypothetical protein
MIGGFFTTAKDAKDAKVGRGVFRVFGFFRGW